MNGLAFSKTGRFLAAAVGQEHRLGRWERITAGRNRTVVIPLEIDDTLDVEAVNYGDASRVGAASASDDDDDDDGADGDQGEDGEGGEASG